MGVLYQTWGVRKKGTGEAFALRNGYRPVMTRRLRQTPGYLRKLKSRQKKLVCRPPRGSFQEVRVTGHPIRYFQTGFLQTDNAGWPNR